MAGIARGAVDSFLESLSGEVSWGVILIQEISGSTKESNHPFDREFVTTDGHAVFVVPSQLGYRPAGIVVNAAFVHTVVKDSFVHKFRCGSILIEWEGHFLKLVVGHAPASSSPLEHYTNYINDLTTLVNPDNSRAEFRRLHKCGDVFTFSTALGVDANVSVGAALDYDDPNVVWSDWYIKEVQSFLGGVYAYNYTAGNVFKKAHRP